MSAPVPEDPRIEFWAITFHKMLAALTRSEETAEPFYGREVGLQRATEKEFREIALVASRRFVPRYDILVSENPTGPSTEALEGLIRSVLAEVRDEFARKQ